MAEGLWFKIGADGSQFQKEAEKTNHALEKMSDNVKAFSKGMTSSFAEAAKSMIGFYSVAKAGTVFQDIINKNDEFAKSMKEVSTLSEEVAENLDEYKKKVLELSTQIPIGANDAAKALYQINSAGHTGADGMKVLEVSAKAAIGGVTDTATAADAITTVLNAYKMSANEAGAVSDKLFTAVRLGKTTMGELGSSISQVAPLAASYGVSIDQILAAVASLTKQGTSTSEAFTQIRAAIVSMGDSLGSTYFQTHTFQQGLVAMREAFPDNNKLKETMGRIQGVQAVLAMTGDNAKGAAQDLDEFTRSAGAAGAAYDKMNTGKGAEMTKLQNNIMKELSGVASKMSAMIAEVASKINEAFDSGAVEDMIDTIKSLITVYGIYKATAITIVATQKALNVIMEEYRYQTALANIGTKTYVSGQVGMAAATKAVTAAQAAQSTAMGLLSRAWQSLSAVIKANPIGMAATVFTMVAASMYLVSKRAWETGKEFRDLDNQVKSTADDIKRQNEKIKQSYNESVAEEVAKIKELKKTINNSHKSYADRKKAIEDLQKIVPEYHAKLNEEGQLINNNTTAIDNYITKLRQKAKAEAAYSMILENEKKILALEDNKADAEGKLDATKANRKKKGVGSGKNKQLAETPMYGETGVDAYLNSMDKEEERFDRLEKKFEARIKTRKTQIDMLNKQNERLEKVYDQNKGAETTTTTTTTTTPIVDPEATKKAKEEAEKRAKLLEQQKEKSKQLYHELLSLMQKNEDDRIALMKEGSAKRLEEINNEYDKEINAVTLQAEKWADANKEAGAKGQASITVDGKSYGGITDKQQKVLQTALDLAQKKRDKATADSNAKEKAAMDAYLAEYGTYQEKKLAITEQYNDKIAQAGTEGEKKALSKKLTEELNKLNTEEFKKNMNWDVIFGDLEDLDKVTLNNVKGQLEDFIETAKDLQPSDIKDLHDALEQIDAQLIMKNSVAALRDSNAQLKIATAEVKKYEDELAKANTSGDSSKVAEVTIKLNRARKKQASAAKNVVKAEKKVKESISELGDGLKALGEQIGGTTGKFMEFASVGIQSSPTIIDNLKHIEKGAKALESAVAILAIIQAAFTAIQSLGNALGVFGDTKEYDKMKEQYESLISIWDEMISKKQEYIDISYGAEAKKAADEVEALYKKQEETARAMGKEYLNAGAGLFSSSNGVKQYENMTVDAMQQLYAVARKAGFSWADAAGGRMTGLFDLSIEQLQALKEDAPLFWAELDSDVQDYLNKILECNDAIEDTREKLKEALTGVSFDSFYDEFVSMLTDMDSNAYDFCNNFEEYLKNAILQSLIANKYKQRINDLYENWVKASDSNGDGIFDLTASETQALRESEKALAQEMIDERDALAQAFDWSSNLTNAESRGFNGMSQDTGDELNGRFAALQISGATIAQSVQDISIQLGTMFANRDAYLDDMLIAQATTNSWLESTYNMHKQMFTQWEEYFRNMDGKIRTL